MLITRTPLRISIGGGGTDLPSYYRERGGFLVAGAIDKYIYLAVNHTFTDDYFLKYSEVERVRHPSEIRHAILREALTAHDAGPGIEIVSMADIPAGTGLGSSGTFTVGLLRALYAFGREHVSTRALAEEACSIEIDRLAQPVGKQDQYVAAFGGLTCFEFHPDDTVTVLPLAVTNDTLHTLEEHLLLFFTGYSREATSILRDQQERSLSHDPVMLANLDHTKELGYEIRSALEDGDCERYAKLMHEHWMSKRERTDGMSNRDIDEWYDAALRNGALGGKLVGAGAGGFLLLYAADPAQVRRTMSSLGLSEVRFTFDHDGSTVQTRAERLMQCVILAGGLGTRLGPLAADVPKHLVDVGGRPFADLQLAWLKAQGVTEVVYCVGHRGDAIRAFVGDGARWGLEVAYVDEGTQLQGTGGALRMAFDHGVLRPWAFVLYGDSYLDLPLSQLHATLAASELDAAMAVFRNDDRWDRSNVVFSPGVPLRYDKARPAELRPAMHHIDYGVSALSTHVLARVTPGVPADLADLMRDLSAEGRVAGFEAAARFYEVGTPEGLDELRRHLATREPAGARPR